MHHAVYKQEPHRVHFSPVVSQLRYREARNCLRPIKGKVPGEDAELLRTKLLESSMQNTLSQVPCTDTAPSNSHLRNQTIYPTVIQYQHAQHHGNLYGQPLTCPTTFYSSVVQQNIYVHGLPTEGNFSSGSKEPRTTSCTLPPGTSVQRFVDAGSGNTPERLKWETFPGAAVTENARGYNPGRIPPQTSYHDKPSVVYQNSHVYQPEIVAKHFTYHQKMPSSSAHNHVYQNLSSLQSEKIKLMSNNEGSESKLITGEASGKRFSTAMSDFESSKVGGTTAGSFEKETPGESRADNNDNVTGALGLLRNNNNIRLHCNNGQHSDCRRNLIKNSQPQELNCNQSSTKCECKNKSGSGKSFNKLSKNFLHWITMGRLGGDTGVQQKQRRSNKEIELISSTKSNAIGKSVDKKFKNKSSDNSSLSYSHRRGSASEKKLLPVTVSNWPVKTNSNFLSETLDFHQSTAAEPCCSYPSSAMEQLENLKERERGVKIRSSDVHPGEAMQSAGRGQRERDSESFFNDLGSEFGIWGANDMKQDRANERVRNELLGTVCGTTATDRGSDESHSCTSTAALEELLTDDELFGSRPDLENSEEQVKELRKHDTRTLPIPRLDPADLPVIRSHVSGSESKQSRNDSKNEMKETALHRKDASTSPIQHLSTFHALNVPVVLSRPEVHKDGSKPDEENSLLLPSVPVPKPRSIKSHENGTSPQLVPESATSSIKAETDELSANVEKILDDIADLELECLKWNTSDVRGTNILDSLQDLSEEGTDESSDSAQPPGNQLILGSQSGRSTLNSNTENQAPYALRSKESGSSVKLKQLSRVTGKPPRPRLTNRCSKGMRDEFLSNGTGMSENTGMEQVVGTSRGRDGMRKPGGDLDAKLLKFREQLHRSREELAKSHPNLDEIQETVRSSVVIDRSDTRGQRASTVRAIHPYTPYTLHAGGVSSYAGANGNYTATITSVVTGAVCTSPTRTSDTSKLSGCNLALTPDPVTLDKERRISQEWNRLCNKGSVNHDNKLRNNQFQLACANSSPGPHFGTKHGNFNFEPERHNSSGIIETDLDAGISPFTVDENGHIEFIYPDDSLPNPSWSAGDTCADDVFDHEEFPRGKLRKSVMQLPLSIFDDEHGILTNSLNSKTKSLVNLGVVPSSTSVRDSSIKSATLSGKYRESNMDEASGLLSVGASQDEKARSMEFLLDDSDKNAHLLPPENNLMRGENRQLSEHELRIQRSLNKLNVPDWYKSYGRSGSASGGVTPTSTPPGHSTSGSKSKIFGSGTGLAGGWSGLSSSKTSSLTSLQSTGRYSGGRSHFNRIRSSGTQSGGARSSRESLMSPSSTASASPSPYYERSSFTYGMPYALTRFATARMSCGASPASLSPSPSPVGGVGSSTSTPVTSAPLSRHHSYSKAPYLGWRSQERLASKSLYRSPAERLAADLLAQKQRSSGSQTSSGGSGTTTPSTEVTTEKRMELTETETSKAETVSASDLSLNNSEESSSKLHRVRSSIKEVSNAIVDYVNESKPLDEGINGGAVSPRKGFVWLETAFVGTKPIDSPGTPDTPGVVMSNNRLESDTSSATAGNGRAKNVFHFEDQGTGNNSKSSGLASQRMRSEEDSYTSAANNGSATVCSPYSSRNEQMEERSNSSSVSSPTLEDILDSLLALRRPNKKPRAKANKGHSKETGQVTKEETTPISDWQERMNQPLDDTAYFPTQDGEFFSTANPIASTTFFNNSQEFADSGVLAHGEPVQATTAENSNDKSYGFHAYSTQRSEDSDKYRLENSSNERRAFDSNPVLETALSYELGVSHNYEQKPSLNQYNEEPAMDQDVDENAFGIPTEIQNTSSSGSAAVNVLANLNDSNPSTPARHRRVSFDLDVSDKDEKSSSRSRRESESLGGSIHCRNSKCGKTATGLEARREFKTCHNCNAYYCSRECRRAHWEKHKKVCMQSRVGALCKQIINHVKEDSYVVQQLSGVARRGVLAKGRGCVKLFFSSPDRAERFLTGGLPELPEPWYIPCGDILPEEMGAQTFSELSEQCRTYNGENRFVLYVSVCVVNEVPTSGAVKWEREMISRSAKLRLVMPKNYEENQLHHQAASTAHLFPEEPVIPPPVPPRDPGRQEHYDIPRPTVSPPPPPLPPHAPAVEAEDDTLILKSVPPPTFHTLSGSETRKLREVSFANIQRHLVERGVDLRQTYPDIYTKLCNYVENDETFLPVTIYPKNSLTGKHFMCVIMPDCTTSADTTIDELPNPLTNIPTGSRQVETINIAEPPTQSYDLR